MRFAKVAGDPAGRNADKRLALWGLVVVVLVGLGLRLYRLDHAKFWFDEYATYVFASEPLSRIWGPDARVETNPPLYYAMQHLWLAFGDSRFAMRTLPALGGVCSIMAAFGLGRALLGWREGLATAAIVAAAPTHIHFSREARCYPWLVAVGTLALIALVQAARVHLKGSAASAAGTRSASHTNEPTAPRTALVAWLTMYSAAAIIAVYLHNTAVLLPALASVFVGWLLVRRKAPRRLLAGWVIANGAIVAAGAWWFVTVARQAQGTLSNFTWMPRPTPEVVYSRLLMAYDAHWSVKLLMLALALYGAWILRGRSGLLVLLGVFVVGQPLAMYLLSLWRPMFVTRVLLWPTVCFFVLMAAGLATIKSPARFAGAVVLLMAAQLAVVAPTYPLERAESGVAALVEHLRTAATPGDLLILYPHEEIDFEHQYEARDHPLNIETVGVRPDDRSYQLDVWCRARRISKGEAIGALETGRRVWVMTARDETDPFLRRLDRAARRESPVWSSGRVTLRWFDRNDAAAIGSVLPPLIR
ncbi:MAG: glycosyltransferase family 39 protein [Phycisphaerales bacterium]|nr:glycosyltransferase family 39 protein [Phycisphaerales bacterium]